MDFGSSQVFLSMFGLGDSLVAALAVCLGALFYLRRVRLERPAIGRFNGRDVVILFAFLVLLPRFYLLLPLWALLSLLTVIFAAALSVGFRPVLAPTPLWLGIGVLLGANLWMGQHMINNVVNWQLVWAQDSLVMLLAVIAIANLYVQGGMQLRHVAWFAGALAVYDSIFSFVLPVSSLLLQQFSSRPMFPAIGMRIGFDEAVIGLGDVLIFAAFTIAAYKAYGRPGVRLALPLVLGFGVILPALSGLLINYGGFLLKFGNLHLDVVVPVQAWFGPAAVVGYLWLRRHYGRERTMREFLASPDAGRLAPAATTVVPAPRIESEPVAQSSGT